MSPLDAIAKLEEARVTTILSKLERGELTLEDARQMVEEAGATFQPLGGKATGQGVVDVEVKYYLPNEVRIDLSENGWLTLTM